MTNAEIAARPAALDPKAANSFAELRVADLIELLNAMSPEEAAGLLANLPSQRLVEAFDQPEFADADRALEALPRDVALATLAGMSADRAAQLLRRLDPALRGGLLAALEPEPAGTLRRLLAYPPHSAGGAMTTEFVSMPATATAAETLRHIREVERSRETIYAIYLVDPATGALVNAISLRALVAAEPDAPALSLARHRDPIAVSPLTDREEVARLFSRHDLLAVPVLDERRRILGIVTVDDVIDAIFAESAEDVQKFGGVEAIESPYFKIGFGEMIRKRAGWLCALFLGEMLTASAMQYFDDALQKAVVLALFIPLIMSSGGNSGSQAASLLIRALALGQIRLRDWWRVALRELPAGALLGAILGAIAFARIGLWQTAGIFDYGDHWLLVALSVSFGLVGVVMFGCFCGAMLPFALQRLGFDPASSSAPFVATLVDVTGLVIYFSAALLFLGGTML